MGSRNMAPTDQEKSELENFFHTATPKQLVKVIDIMEQQKSDVWSGELWHDLTQSVKRLAFQAMLQALDARTHTYTCSNTKRYYTELHINEKWNSVILCISKKDSRNLDAMYQRLYDQHKDELLRMIDYSRASHAVLVKDGVR